MFDEHDEECMCDECMVRDSLNGEIEALNARLRSATAEITRLTKERDDARANARILAHSYEHDCRPLARAVKESLAYPVVPEGTRSK